MFQGFFVRLTALCIWVPAVVLTYLLVEEFTEGQSQIIVGLSMLALLICSCSLIHARFAWQRGARPEAFGALLVYIMGAGVLLFLELGFWASTVSTTHEALVRADAARSGVEALMKRDRDALGKGSVETSAEIRAKMDAELAKRVGTKTLGQTTANCLDTGAGLYRLCGDFLGLKAALAKAQAAEKVEARIWDAGTVAGSSKGLKRDLFAGAQSLSRSLGGTAEAWAATLSFLFVALLMTARDLSLSIAFSPRKRAVPAAVPQAESFEREDYLADIEAKLSEAAERTEPAAAPAPEAPSPTPPPSGPRKPRITHKEVNLEAQTVKIHDGETPGGRTVPFRGVERAELPSFASELFEESDVPRRRTANRKRENRKEVVIGAAKKWLRECTDRESGAVCSADDAWPSYRDWCGENEMKHLPRSRFESTISKKVGSVSVDGKKHFVGLVLVAPVEERVRSAA
jgi:hypothetical protein